MFEFTISLEIICYITSTNITALLFHWVILINNWTVSYLNFQVEALLLCVTFWNGLNICLIGLFLSVQLLILFTKVLFFTKSLKPHEMLDKLCSLLLKYKRCIYFYIQVQCANDGLCVNISNNEYKCQCAEGFYGQTCREYNPCSTQPCQNDGHCHNITESEYTCTCFYGHFGVHCERFDPCFSSPCANGGMCKNHSDTEHSCSCLDGYLGSSSLNYIT